MLKTEPCGTPPKNTETCLPENKLCLFNAHTFFLWCLEILLTFSSTDALFSNIMPFVLSVMPVVHFGNAFFFWYVKYKIKISKANVVEHFETVKHKKTSWTVNMQVWGCDSLLLPRVSKNKHSLTVCVSVPVIRWRFLPW